MLFSPDGNDYNAEDDLNIEIPGAKYYVSQILSYSEVEVVDKGKQTLDLELFITYVGIFIIQQIQNDLNFLELFHARRHFGFDHFDGETQERFLNFKGKWISSNKLAERLMNKKKHPEIGSDFVAVIFTRVSTVYALLKSRNLTKNNIIDCSKEVGEFIAEKTLELDPSPSFFSHRALPIQMRIYSMNSAAFSLKKYKDKIFNPNL